MSFYPQPLFSKNRIDNAGYRLADGGFTAEDVEVLENWRASHAQVMNTFRQIIYNRLKKVDAQFVQRLKRGPTIVDKLARDRRMRVRLSQMQDIAGSRLIFPNVDSLNEFRALMNSAKFSHELRWSKDYMNEPKEDGYRGVHEIYVYNVVPKKGHAGDEQPWNGLRVEIQYRTNIQHVWATAVETAGFLTANNPKFGRGSEAFIDFFRVASEMFARCHENMFGPLQGLTNTDLATRFLELSEETHVLDIFENAKPLLLRDGFRRTAIIVLYVDRDRADPVNVFYYDSVVAALNEYNRLEKELVGQADIVLVRADESESIKSAYRNYFTDTEEFVRLLRQAWDILQHSEQYGIRMPDCV